MIKTLPQQTSCSTTHTLLTTNQHCPYCGYCPTCGRPYRRPYQYYPPYNPGYPYWNNPTWTVQYNNFLN